MKDVLAFPNPTPPAPGDRAVPRLVTLEQLHRLFPCYSTRTLRRWATAAAPHDVFVRGSRKTIPGNGLAPAIIRRGRVIVVDVDRFVKWLYEDPASP